MVKNICPKTRVKSKRSMIFLNGWDLYAEVDGLEMTVQFGAKTGHLDENEKPIGLQTLHFRRPLLEDPLLKGPPSFVSPFTLKTVYFDFFVPSKWVSKGIGPESDAKWSNFIANHNGSHTLCIRLLFEKVILSDKNGMYLMTGRKWEWRLPVVDNESNEPWIILLLYINHIYENRFTVILLNQYFTTSHKSSAFFRPGRSRSWQDRIISKTIFPSDQILVPKILFLPRKDRSFRKKII